MRVGTRYMKSNNINKTNDYYIAIEMVTNM